MGKYLYKKSNIIITLLVDVFFFVWAYIIGKSEKYYIGIIWVTAIFLLYYILEITFTIYTVEEHKLIYKSIFKRVVLKWEDIGFIEYRKPLLLEEYSVIIFSKDGEYEIPINSWINEYKILLETIINKTKNNEHIKIDTKITI